MSECQTCLTRQRAIALLRGDLAHAARKLSKYQGTDLERRHRPAVLEAKASLADARQVYAQHLESDHS